MEVDYMSYINNFKKGMLLVFSGTKYIYDILKRLFD